MAFEEAADKSFSKLRPSVERDYGVGETKQQPAILLETWLIPFGVPKCDYTAQGVLWAHWCLAVGMWPILARCEDALIGWPATFVSLEALG